MDEIARKRLGEVLTTYFVASGYSKGFTNKELYYLTRAMVDTEIILSFPELLPTNIQSEEFRGQEQL